MNIVNAVNRWRSGKEIPRLSPIPTSIIIFTLLVCTLPFGTGFAKWSCAIASIVGVAFLIFMTHSASTVSAVALPSALLFLLTGSFLLPSVLISVTVTVGAGAFLINSARSYALLLLIPAAYVTSLGAGGDWRIALLCTVCLPALIALSRASYGGASRLSAICRTSAALGASAIALILILFVTNDVEIAFDTLRAYIDAMRDSVYSDLREQMLANPELYEDISQTAATYSKALFSLIPAFFICTLNYLAFSAQKIHTSLMNANGFAEFVSKKSSSFIMSSAAGKMFFVSAAAVTLFALFGDISLMETAENLMVILTPGLFIIGVFRMLGKTGEKRFGLIFIILICFMFFTYTSACAFILASIGAYTSISQKGRKDLID